MGCTIDLLFCPIAGQANKGAGLEPMYVVEWLNDRSFDWGKSI